MAIPEPCHVGYPGLGAETLEPVELGVFPDEDRYGRPFEPGQGPESNHSSAARRYLDRLGLGVEDLFQHALAVLHDPVYREANAGALRMEWPRIPVPGWPDRDATGAEEELAASAARGRELAAIAVPSATDGTNMTGEDFALAAGWRHFGQGGVVVPGPVRVVERPHTADDRAALGDSVPYIR